MSRDKSSQMAPADYQRRVLISVLGTSPQVVTETLYALMSAEQPFIPTEVILVTTSSGAGKAREKLLGQSPTVLENMAHDYGWPGIPFGEDSIRVVSDREGRELDDIRSQADSEALADCITELVRDITSDDDSALHVSIAGGRKTMSFFAGYVLTLFGRQQDRLSHVLVDEKLIGTDFFYPAPGENVDVSLAEIPFVDMRSGMSDLILKSGRSFAGTIAAMRSARHSEPKLVLDTENKRVMANNDVFELPPRIMTLLIMMAKRVLDGRQGFSREGDDVEDRACGEEYRNIMLSVYGEWGDERPLEAIASTGRYDVAHRDGHRTGLKKALEAQLGNGCAKPYLIDVNGKKGRKKCYGLTLRPEQIEFSDLSLHNVTV